MDCWLCSPTWVNLIPWRRSDCQTTAPSASMIVPESGSRNVSCRLAFLFKAGISTWIPFWLRFHVTPRNVCVSAMQITCARMGTRTCFRRFSNIPPVNVRGRSTLLFRGRSRVYADTADHSIDLNDALTKFESQPTKQRSRGEVWPEIGYSLDSGASARGARLLMCLTGGQSCASPQ